MFYHPVAKFINQTIYYQKEGRKFFLPISKNGSRTMDVALRNDFRYNVTSLTSLHANKEYTIVCFLREPIDRFWAGITSSFYNRLYKHRDTKAAKVMVDYLTKTFFVDGNTLPQYYSVLRCYDYCPNSKFEFYSYKKIGGIIGTNEWVNKSDPQKVEEMKEWILSIKNCLKPLERSYFPDKILWEEFLDRTVSFEEIIERFSQEREYFDRFSIAKSM